MTIESRIVETNKGEFPPADVLIQINGSSFYTNSYGQGFKQMGDGYMQLYDKNEMLQLAKKGKALSDHSYNLAVLVVTGYLRRRGDLPPTESKTSTDIPITQGSRSVFASRR